MEDGLNNECPCNSGENIENCCGKNLSDIGLNITADEKDTLLLEWVSKYGPTMANTFSDKTQKYVYRLSRYLDEIMDVYLGRPFPSPLEITGDTHETYMFLKHNNALHIVAAYRLLSEGLFIQSGALLRTAIESSMVLLDVFINPAALDRIENNTYKAQSVLKRVKIYIPKNIVDWYGYFSANFSHVGAIHSSQYIPRACYPDNWVILTGLQNILRSIVTYHELLERIYFFDIKKPWFWKITNGDIVFNDNSKIFIWADKLGKEIKNEFEEKYPDEETLKSNKTVTLKT